MPEFRRLGLKLNKQGVPRLGDSLNAFSSAEVLFGITYDEAIDLFTPDYNEQDATPKQVARKIERFVAKRSHG